MKSEEKTLKYYDEHGKEWGESHHGFDEESFWKKEMERFHELLPAGSILEIGSGTGRDASNLIKLGYNYVGTDASEGLLKLAKERNPGGVFKKVRVQDLNKIFSKDEFDGFWTAATLLHLPKAEIGNSLKNIYDVVKNNGIGFISIKMGQGEAEDETGRLFAYYSQSEFSDLLEKNNFKILHLNTQAITEETTWLVYLVRVSK